MSELKYLVMATQEDGTSQTNGDVTVPTTIFDIQSMSLSVKVNKKFVIYNTSFKS